MRFMVMVKGNAQSEAGVMPSEELLSAMTKFNEELVEAGMMLDGAGLHPTSKGFRVDYDRGNFAVTDGPFPETKEIIAGYWLLKGNSLEEIVEWCKRIPGDKGNGGDEGQVEIRPLYEMEDFDEPSGESGDWCAKEMEAREKVDANLAAPARGERRIRYLGMLMSDASTEAGTPPKEEVMNEMGDLIAELAEKGIFQGGEGLKPSSQGARVYFKKGEAPRVMDGPFPETKELLAGYCIMSVTSREEAEEYGKRFIKIHCEGTDQPVGRCEFRRYFEMEDFAPSPAVEEAYKLGEKMAGKSA